MFKVRDNVFAKVPCPILRLKGTCNVTNCLFDHAKAKRKSISEEQPIPKRSRANSVNSIPTQQKKSEIEEKAPVPRKDVTFVIPRSLSNLKTSIPRAQRLECTRRIAKYYKEKESTTPNLEAIEKEYALASNSKSVKEYEEQVVKLLGAAEAPKVDPKHFSPIELYPSPATLPVRRKFVELFIEAIKRMNPDVATPVLTAMDEEFKVASANSSATYNLAVKRKLYEINHPEKVKTNSKRTFSKTEYLTELRNLCIPVEKLAKFGYIMDFPEQIEYPEPLRHCNRCKQEFKLEDAAKPADCRYHSGRMVKNDHKVRIYSCCGGVVGETDTDPCAKADHHVFYWLNPAEMHHFLPFIKTAEVWKTRKGSLQAVGIDCEMGFTTKGFELLRVTAVDFFSGEEVLDILVRPKGEVLDLNTRWSGVAEIKEEALSFEDTITLLGEIVDANTVMVGHGLENDMNAMRLIHEKVVDTAILYPKHKATPTFRFSLKQLSFQYLGRNIQSGEHDSGEDSLAAIDITKHFIEQELEKVV